MTLRLLGYWVEPGEGDWPDPRAFMTPDADPEVQRRVSEYLRGGTAYVATAGFSRCRLCGRPNGSTELTDGTYFVWPEGLAHYVEAHDLRLPDEVVAVMDHPPPRVDAEAFEEDIETGRIKVDEDWWRALHDPFGR